MSSSSIDLLDYAAALQDSDEEVELRSCVSRAYYAAYHQANDWHSALGSPGSASGGTGVHRTLIDRLRNPTVTGSDRMLSKKLGYVLDAMKVLRQKADYNLADTVTGLDAQNTVAYAEKVLAEAAAPVALRSSAAC